MAVPLAEQILAVVKEGLGLWKTFIATRQEAYNRQQDKKQNAAIESAEKLIFEADGLIARLPEDIKKKEKKPLGQITHFRKRFFHYH